MQASNVGPPAAERRAARLQIRTFSRGKLLYFCTAVLLEAKIARQCEMEDASELEFAASKVSIVATRVDGDIDDPAFICQVDTDAGDVWPICRRLSAFAELRGELTADGNPEVAAVRFPKQLPARLLGAQPLKALGGLLFQPQAEAEETVTERKAVLEAWINEVLAVCPGDKRLLTFVADDGSVTTAQARDYGIVVVSSNPARKVDAESQPDIAAAQEQHKARQARKNRSVLDELDTNEVCGPALFMEPFSPVLAL